MNGLNSLYVCAVLTELRLAGESSAVHVSKYPDVKAVIRASNCVL